MGTVYKLLLFALIFIAAALAGYAAFKSLNKKIRDSETGWQLLANSLLLLLVNAALFFAAITLLVYSYSWLSDME